MGKFQGLENLFLNVFHDTLFVFLINKGEEISYWDFKSLCNFSRCCYVNIIYFISPYGKEELVRAKVIQAPGHL